MVGRMENIQEEVFILYAMHICMLVPAQLLNTGLLLLIISLAIWSVDPLL